MSKYNLLSKYEWILFTISLIPIFDAILNILPNNIPILQTILHKLYMMNMYKYFHALLFCIIIIYIYRMCKMDIFSTNEKIIVIVLIVFFLRFQILTILNIWNIILESILDNKPMNIDKKLFPNHVKFENNFIPLRNEVLDIINKNEIPCFDKVLPYVKSLVTHKNNNCWKWLFLKHGDKINENLLKDYPILYELMSDDMIANCSISLLEPEVSIPAHRGYFKGFLRYHICIETPDNDIDKPYIICGGVKYTWKTGQGILFDDMYIHEVVNNSKHRRIVLFIDVYRTNLPEPFYTITKLLSKLISSNKLLNLIIDKQHEQIKK